MAQREKGAMHKGLSALQPRLLQHFASCTEQARCFHPPAAIR